MPSFKGIDASIEPAAKGEKVMTLQELLQTYYRKE
jgi:formylmethanofuran dehydrogenase subunit D